MRWEMEHLLQRRTLLGRWPFFDWIVRSRVGDIGIVVGKETTMEGIRRFAA